MYNLVALMPDRSPARPSFVDTRTAVVRATPAQAFAPIRRIGGADGWYYANHLWRLRHLVDRVLRRPVPWGRRDPDECRPGEGIDGWRVDRYEPDRHLRLEAEIWMPGRGWLDFEVRPLDDGHVEIRQVASFAPAGLLGQVYWVALLPIHRAVFRGMIRAIAARVADAAARPD